LLPHIKEEIPSFYRKLFGSVSACRTSRSLRIGFLVIALLPKCGLRPLDVGVRRPTASVTHLGQELVGSVRQDCVVANQRGEEYGRRDEAGIGKRSVDERKSIELVTEQLHGVDIVRQRDRRVLAVVQRERLVQFDGTSLERRVTVENRLCRLTGCVVLGRCLGELVDDLLWDDHGVRIEEKVEWIR